MAERKAFNFYKSYFDVFEELKSDKDKLSFIKALLNRQFYGEEPINLSGMVKFAYISQQFNIDQQVSGWESKSKCKLTRPTEGGLQGESKGGSQQEEEKGEVEDKEEEQPMVNFSIFWNLYDKKVGNKDSCMKIWGKLSNDERQKIIGILPSWKRQFSDKQFQPYPTTFFNQKRWNDEITTKQDEKTEQSDKFGEDRFNIIRY